MDEQMLSLKVKKRMKSYMKVLNSLNKSVDFQTGDDFNFVHMTNQEG